MIGASRRPFHMEKMLVLIFCVVVIAASRKKENIGGLINVAKSGGIEERPLRGRENTGMEFK